MTRETRENLQNFRNRVERLEKPALTSPFYSKIGWPVLIAGGLIWLITVVLPGSQFIPALMSAVLIAIGAVSVVMSYLSEHSEGIEETEKSKRIRDRSNVAKCLYLEGKVPDGKGIVGRCRLYEFDMTDLPYCIYCREYTSSKGEPDV